MQIDKNLIKNIARLARLELTEKEIDKFIPELKEILKVFSKIDEIDTNGVKPSFQPVELKNFTRDDVVEKSLSQDEALLNTEHKTNGYFKGPRAV